LQITHQEEDKVVGLNVRGSGIGDNEVRDVSFRRWKFNAVDGDGTVITIRVDSTLSAEAKFLSPGTIFTSSTAFPVYVNYGDQYNMRCGIVLSEFSIIGHAALPIPADVTPARLIVKPREITASKSQAREAREARINEAIDARISEAIEAEIVLGPRKSKASSDGPGDNEGSGDGGTGGAPSATNIIEPNECEGELCSKAQVEFITCITKCVPIDKVPLKKVANECVFFNVDFDKAVNKNRRFLLYYYYATSVYQFHGSGNRIELPKCLVTAIRKKYPDEISNK